MSGSALSVSAVKIIADTSAMTAALSALAVAIEFGDRPLQTRRTLGERALKLINQGRAVNFDSYTATGTGELIVAAKPSQGFLRLLAAAGAGNINAGGVEHG